MTRPLHSTTYHPQIDGQTKRVNQCLEMYLRCAVHQSPQHWKHYLSLAELWYNSSFHSSPGCSPFHALYGYHPDVGIMPVTGSPTAAEPKVTDILTDKATHVEMLKEQLAAAHSRMKIAADHHHTDHVFQAGEQVLLKL